MSTHTENSNLLWDDFTGGASDSSSSIGETGWSIFSTADAGHSINYVAGEASHPGICAVSCAPVANSILACCRHRPNSTLIPPVFLGDVCAFTFVVRLVTAITNMRVILGLASNPIGATSNVLDGGLDGVYAIFDPALSGQWRINTRSVGTNSLVSTGVTVLLNTWYQITFSRADPTGRWQVQINGGSQLLANTAAPAGVSLCPTLSVQSTTANPRVVHLDYFDMLTQPLKRFV